MVNCFSIPNASVSLHANDSCVPVCSKQDRKTLLSEELSNFFFWLKSNCLSLKVFKTYFVKFNGVIVYACVSKSFLDSVFLQQKCSLRKVNKTQKTVNQLLILREAVKENNSRRGDYSHNCGKWLKPNY